MTDFVYEGHKLDYRSYGVGYPLILICTGQLAPELSRRYRVIAIETDDPIEPAALGRATLGLMDALMIKRAHVLGFKVGGMAAQGMAISYPRRVKGLILVATEPVSGYGDIITARTLVLSGSADKIVRPVNSTILAEGIPRSELVILQGCGHQVLEEQPVICSQAILGFLRRVDSWGE